MTIRETVLIFATVILIILLGLTIQNDKNREKYEKDLTESVAESLDVKKEKVDLVTIDEKKLYKTAIDGKGYEIYIDKEGNLSNILEISKESK